MAGLLGNRLLNDHRRSTLSSQVMQICCKCVWKARETQPSLPLVRWASDTSTASQVGDPTRDVYFKRSVLKLPQGEYKYDAEDEKAFYGHILLETVWNTYASDPRTEPSNSSMKPHPRCKLATGRASGFCQTTFGVWDSTHVMFGPNSHGSSINRDVVLANNQNYNETRDYDDGGKIKVILRPVPVCGKEDHFIFVDLVQQL
ncbi:MAG: hypothetical protein Q9199_005295 [Rusavskia elegans]